MDRARGLHSRAHRQLRDSSYRTCRKDVSHFCTDQIPTLKCHRNQCRETRVSWARGKWKWTWQCSHFSPYGRISCQPNPLSLSSLTAGKKLVYFARTLLFYLSQQIFSTNTYLFSVISCTLKELRKTLKLPPPPPWMNEWVMLKSWLSLLLHKF